MSTNLFDKPIKPITESSIIVIEDSSFPDLIHLSMTADVSSRLSYFNKDRPYITGKLIYESIKFNKPTSVKNKIIEYLSSVNIKAEYHSQWFKSEYKDTIISTIKNAEEHLS